MTAAHASATTIRRYRPRYQAPEELLTSSAVAKRWSRSNSAATTPNRSPPQNGSATDEPGPEWPLPQQTPSARFGEEIMVGTPRAAATPGPIATPEWMKSFQDSGGIVEVTPRRRVQQSLVTPAAALSSFNGASLSTPALDRRRPSATTPRQTTMMFGTDFEEVARRRQALYMAEEGNRILNAANAHARRVPHVSARGVPATAEPVTFIDVLSRKKAKERQQHSAPAASVATTAAPATPAIAKVDGSRVPQRPQGVVPRSAHAPPTSAASMLQQYLDTIAMKPVVVERRQDPEAPVLATNPRSIPMTSDDCADLGAVAALPLISDADQRSSTGDEHAQPCTAENPLQAPAPLMLAQPCTADDRLLEANRCSPTPMADTAALATAEASAANASTEVLQDVAMNPAECEASGGTPATAPVDTDDVPGGATELREYIACYQDRNVQELFRHDLQVDATLTTFGAFMKQDWHAAVAPSSEAAMLLLEGPTQGPMANASRKTALSAFSNDVCEAIATCAVEYAIVEVITEVLNQMDTGA